MLCFELGEEDFGEACGDCDEIRGVECECFGVGLERFEGDGVAEVEGFYCWGDGGWELVEDVGKFSRDGDECVME